MSSHRSAIIASVIRQVVARKALDIPPDIADIVSITDVTLNADVSIASVRVSALKGKAEAVSYLKKHNGEIRKELASMLKTYGIPQLRFEQDDQVERIGRLEALLDETAKKNDK